MIVFENSRRSIILYSCKNCKRPFKAELFDKRLNEVIEEVVIHDIGNFAFYMDTKGILQQAQEYLKER